MQTLFFLKLGGSLITDKDQERTPRLEVIQRLAGEIAEARIAQPDLQLLIGHGSGSYGHTAARIYNTRSGVDSQLEWMGFAKVWYQARALNQIVLEKLVAAGLPVVAFPPSAFMLAQNGQALPPETHHLKAALANGLVPLVNGDVVFDSVLGGTILSTEDVFAALAPALQPARILLAGIETGVYTDFPTCLHLAPYITPFTMQSMDNQIRGSVSIDVTGGMRQKVERMLSLSQQIPGLEALIFSGLEPGNLRASLLGNQPGTRIHS
jgi:isopentenyl phosphate kinase